MNKVVLIGRITKDPELKQTPTGVAVVSFTIAVNRTYQNANGERQADFINCVAWRGQAENLARFIKKGALIAVDGSIQTRQYDDQNGVRRYVTEVMANQVTFLESKKDNSNGYDDFNQVPQQNYNQGYNQNYNQMNQSYNGGYNQQAPSYNNYQNNNYPNQNNNYNNAPKKDSNPFDDIDKAFDISSEDLPF